jgi:hypothetical protein
VLDVEYLLNPSACLDRALVYRYRTGVLRPKLREVLSAIAERDGNLVLDCSPSELFSLSVGGGLFQGVGICDWPEKDLKVTAGQITAGLEAICRPDGQAVVLFVSEEREVLKHPLWSKVEDACDVMREPLANLATLLPIMRYLESRSVPRNELLSQREFLNYFKDIVGQDSMCLAELKQAFDRAVLLFVDPDTGVFSGEGAGRDQQRSRSIVMRPLRSMVERRDRLQLPELLRGLAVRFPSGRRGGELADELARHTQTLLKPSASTDRTKSASGQDAWFQSKPEDRESMVLVWACVLLIFARRFLEIDVPQHSSGLRADQTLVLVDEMGREFFDRTAPAMASDPLVGLWAELQTSISLARASSEQTDTAFGKLVRDLNCLLAQLSVVEGQWVARLLDLLSNDANIASEWLADASSSLGLVSELHPRSFVDVIGHQLAIQGMQQRISSNRHSIPLILCGPQGVGKKTLGRIYANRLLCEGELNVSGSPCGKCPTCKEFETGRPLDFIEFDAGSSSTAQYVQKQLLNDLRYAPASGRRVVMVTNPEVNPQLVEVCLKTLEQSSAVNSFIFTVTDARGLSGAGQSRCEMYRLAALTQLESRRLAERVLGPTAGKYDSQALDVMVAESGGLPRRLRELCSRVASTHSTTLAEVRSVLGLGWASVTISFWRLLLAQQEPNESLFGCLVGVSLSEAVYRVRSVLNEMYHVHASGETRHPALLHLEGDPISELVSTISARSAGRGMSFMALWAALSEHWLCDDHADVAGFRNASLKSHAIVHLDSSAAVIPP